MALVALVALSAPQAAVEPAAAQPAAKRPNIVVVLTDDQRHDTLGVMPQVQEHLVGKGVSFSRAFVSNSICCPARATFLTGNYAHTTGVYSNRRPFGGMWGFRHGGAERSTIATWLRASGYRTSFMGKYMNSYTRGIAPGWHEWRALVGGNFTNFVFNVNGQNQGFAGEHVSTYLAREAAAFIERRSAKEAPFLLYVSTPVPHAPATPLPEHADAFSDLPPYASPALNEEDVSDKPAYVRDYPLQDPAVIEAWRIAQLRSLLGADQMVGTILETLARTEQLADTIVVYTSDNGMQWGDHRLRGAHKSVPYESSIRVPLVVRYDRRVARARTERALVSNLDVAATIAAAAGVRLRSEGRSLLPFLRDREPRGGWRERVLIESMGGESRTDRIPTYCAVRSQRHMYVLYGTNEEELYDLREDPYQLENLARGREHAADVADGRRAVRRLCFPPPPGFEPAALCTLRGTRGADRLVGGPADDAVCPRGGRDRVRTEAGNDTVFAGARDVGGQSTATFRPAANGAPGSRIRLGPGADRAYVLNGLRDLVTCGEGRDRVIADRFDVVARDCERVQRAPRVFSGGGRG